jgi:hypothetical protein
MASPESLPSTESPPNPDETTPLTAKAFLQRNLIPIALGGLLVVVAVAVVLLTPNKNQTAEPSRTTRTSTVPAQTDPDGAPGTSIAPGESFTEGTVENPTNPSIPDTLLQSGEAPAVGDGIPAGSEPNKEDFDVPMIKPEGAPDFPGESVTPSEYVVGDAALDAALLVVVTPLWDPAVPPEVKAALLGSPDTTAAWQALNARNLGIQGVTRMTSTGLPGPGTCDVFGLSAGCSTASFIVRIGDQDVPLSATFVSVDGTWVPTVRSACDSLADLGTTCPT